MARLPKCQNTCFATETRLGDDLEQLWDHPNSPVTLKKRILRTVLEEVVADTTDDPPSVHLKLHWAGGTHTELIVRKNRTGYHNHINSEEVTALIRELALVCEDSAIVSILNRLGYRTGNGNTWTEKRVQHVRHTKGFPACPPPDQRRWLTMRQAASTLGVSEAVVRRLIEQKTLPAKQIVKFAPWVIERTDLDLPAVHRAIRLVRTGRRDPARAPNDAQTIMFSNPEEQLGEI
jgi:Helix-turn-helix domain